jgi:hypothetical protein
MPRAYNTSAVAAALGAPQKWLDNILTHHQIAGVQCAGQGVSRRMSPDSVLTIFIAKVLIDRLGCAAGPALQASSQIVVQGAADLGPGFNLTVDRAIIEATLNAKLFDAVQGAPPKRRGRPPAHKPTPTESGN